MSKYLAWTVVFAVAPVFGGNTARADLPASRNVVFSIRQTPTDSTSPVTFTMTLHLVASQVHGDYVGWTVDTATFNKLGAAPKQWVKEFPALDTADGLWWVEHNDPLNPESSEFAATPLITGTAVAQDSSYTDLEYNYQGFTRPVEGRVELVQPTAHYSFQAIAEPEPEEESGEEDEEPVEVDETTAVI